MHGLSLHVIHDSSSSFSLLKRLRLRREVIRGRGCIHQQYKIEGRQTCNSVESRFPEPPKTLTKRRFPWISFTQSNFAIFDSFDFSKPIFVSFRGSKNRDSAL